MREFQDDQGGAWVASVGSDESGDYKGRFYVTFTADGDGRAYALKDIRWNSEGTGQHALETMSGVELRRRLRSALGRSGQRTQALD